MSESQAPEGGSQTDQPRFWSTNTKLIVGIALLALGAGLLFQLRPLLTPLSFALILTYLLLPIVDALERRTFLSWRGATNIVFILLVLILLSSLTASGVAIANQIQNLIEIIEIFLEDLPMIVEEWINSDLVLVIPVINYQIDLSDSIRNLNIDLLGLSEQILSAVQPILGQAGGFVGRAAGSVLTTLGWGGFILAVTYLTLGEARQGRKFLKRELDSMSYDIGRMTRELGYVWNAFLRGQVLVFLISSSTMFVVMTILDMPYAVGLALLAGFARFIPYVGQYISGTVNALVAFFLGAGNHFGLDPLLYMLLVVGVAFLHDQSYDSLVIPKLIGNVLGVHPALVLIVALIAVTWIGVLGLLLAAPVLASFQLILGFVIRKMLDQDPWPDEETSPPTLRQQLKEIFRTARDGAVKAFERIRSFFSRLFKRNKNND